MNAGDDSLLSDDIAFHGDGHEDTKMGTDTDRKVSNRFLSAPSIKIYGQGK